MCRHLAYLGPPVPLAALLLDPPHSLLRQSWAPRGHARRRHGQRRRLRRRLVPRAGRADAGPLPQRGADLGGRVVRRGWPRPPASGAVLAAVRSATVGMPVAETAARAVRRRAAGCSATTGWSAAGRDSVAGARRARCRSPTCSPWTRPTDAALLWALVRAPAAGRRRPGRGAGRRRSPRSPPPRPGSRLNLLLTDGTGDRGHDLGPRAVACAPTTAQRPGRLRAARRRPRLARGARPAPAWSARPGRCTARDRCDRRPTGDRMTRPRLLDVHLTERRRRRRAARRRPRRARPRRPKWLPPKWFYDARGSELFEQITELPEYYPTRAERAMLDRAGRRDRRGHRAPTRWSSWAPARRRRPGCCSTRSRRAGTLRALRAAGRQRVRAAARPLDALAARVPGPGAARRRRRLHRAPGPAAGRRRAGWSPSSAARSATCCRPSGRRSSRALRGGAASRGSSCCSAPTW